jgi:hypothetical protein
VYSPLPYVKHQNSIAYFHHCFPLHRVFAEETNRLIKRRLGGDSGEDGGGPKTFFRQKSSNDLGDQPGDGTTFTFTVGRDENGGGDEVERQFTSSELIDALIGADKEAFNDQDKITAFINQLKDGADNKNAKKPSEFRKKRLTYEHQPSGGSSSVDKKVPQKLVAGNSTKDKSKAKRTTIFSSSEIGVRQDKKAPFASSLMGTFSCHGIEPGEDEDGEDAVHDKINQDRGCVVYPYRSSEDEALFMVLDGHGEQGDRISEFVMRQIVISLEKHPSLSTDPPAALLETFVKTNTALMVTPMNYMTSGCTCVAVYMIGRTFYVANSGDSRAVMAQDAGNGKVTAKDLSRDHKPDDADEMARIKEWGGIKCICVYVDRNVFWCMYIFVYTSIYVYMYLFTYICMHKWIYL